jgi:hypothetical protein
MIGGMIVGSRGVDEERDEVEVGPWVGAWPDEPRYDRSCSPRVTPNVVDRYRYWRHEAIVAELDSRRHAFHVAIGELAARPEHRHGRAHG